MTHRAFSAPRTALVAAPAADALEPRTMLSGNVITAQTGQTTYHVDAGEVLFVPTDFRGDILANVDGGGRVSFARGSRVGDVIVNTAGTGEVLTFVGEGAFVQSLEINGTGLRERVTLKRDAVVNRLEFNGEAGNDTVRLDALARVNQLQFVGGGDADRLDILGTVADETVVDFGNGNDLLLIRGVADLNGALLGTFGNGNDRSIITGPDLRSVDLSYGSGNDWAFFRQSATLVDGDLVLDFGGGTDRLDSLAGGIDVTGAMSVFMSAGTDFVRVVNVDVAGNQLIDLGNSPSASGGGGREVVIFGPDTIGGSSTVVFRGDASIRELEARDIAGAYQLLGGSGAAVVRLEQGSTIDGGFLFENFGPTLLSAEIDVTLGGVDITTGVFNDRVFILGGSQLVGDFTAFTGGGNDQFVFDGGQVDITGTVDIDTGWNSDTFETGNLFVDGTLMLNLGNSIDGVGQNVARLGANVVTGNFEATFRGPTIYIEEAAQTVFGDYRMFGTFGAVTYRANPGTSVAGSYIYRSYGDNDVIAAFSVANDARFVGGDRSDSFDLAGISVGSILDVSTDGGQDFVSILDSVFENKVSVLLGDDDDLLLNGNTVFNGQSFLDGGAGFDELQDFGNGFNVNFEAAI